MEDTTPPVHTITITGAELAAHIAARRAATSRATAALRARGLALPRRPPPPVELHATRCQCGTRHTVAAPVGGTAEIRCHVCRHTVTAGSAR